MTHVAFESPFTYIEPIAIAHQRVVKKMSIDLCHAVTSYCG